MSRRNRQRKKGRASRGPRSYVEGHRGGAAPGSRHEPDLLADVRARLATGEPLDLLAEVSTLLEALSPRRRHPLERADPDEPALPTLEEMVRSFADVDSPETSALLAGMAQLAPDELVRARARRAHGGRSHQLPGWLRQLGHAQCGRATEMVDALGDGDDVIFEIRLPAGGGDVRTLTVIVYIDHNLGGAAKDGFAIPGTLDDVVAIVKAESDTADDATFRPLDPADARARISEAVEHGALIFPPLESDTWPASRPLVQWGLRLLPEGGVGYQRPEWDDAARKALTAAFFASPHARSLTVDQRELFDSILWFGTDYGPGDPLHWSPASVEILLADWLPRKVVAPAGFLAQAPALLRAFIAYAHAERSIRSGLTAQTLAVVDALEDEYLAVIRAPRPQGPAALLAAMGALEGDEPWGMPGFSAEPYDPDEFMLDLLRRDVGGDEALRALDAKPLPDEAFVWDGIDLDVQEKVADVLERCDRFCDDLLDIEHRTAVRRYLGKVARSGPQVFRRRGSAASAAAAICWTIGKANEVFSAAGGGLLVKDLASFFGVAQSNVSQRAGTLLKAVVVQSMYDYYPAWHVALEDAGLLVADRRRRIIERRDRCVSDDPPF